MVNRPGGLMVRVSGMHTPCSKQERERKELVENEPGRPRKPMTSSEETALYKQNTQVSF